MGTIIDKLKKYTLSMNGKKPATEKSVENLNYETIKTLDCLTWCSRYVENELPKYSSDDIINMADIQEDDIEALRTTPGAYLGSCRYKLPEDLNDTVYTDIFDTVCLACSSGFLLLFVK